MPEQLIKINKRKIFRVSDARFRTYGRVLEGIDVGKLTAYMEQYTTVPREGNLYLESIPEMEKSEAYSVFRDELYGGMEIQIGYCNGKNSTLNGLEYHKGSEINVGVTDFLLFLGHVWDIEDNHYEAERAEVFYVEKGQVLELYQTTLHLSPCRTTKEGYKVIVILPKGTNTPLKKAPAATKEGNLLLKKNKWVLAHPDRKQLTDQGAFPGIIGNNEELKYLP